MTTWGNICRICSSPTDYEIFAKIPNYLHANSNEFLSWQKPINVLLEETTGLKISLDDGLPRNICALCISYLKHAVNFREQCINNTLGLKAVELLRMQMNKSEIGKKQKDKESLLITADELSYAEERQSDTNLLVNNISHQQQDQDKVCKQLLNNRFQANMPTQENVEQQLRYLNLLFDKDTNTGLRPKYRGSAAAGTSTVAGASTADQAFAAEEDYLTESSDSDCNEDDGNGKKNIFSYKEKNFEEDDIMDTAELRDAITINIPESCKERKCRACFKRFMFEESYIEHMDACIEYKFLVYIEEINRLLDIRRNKAISPHEFIRRMIFCLRKTGEWLQKTNCGDILTTDLLINGNGNGSGVISSNDNEVIIGNGIDAIGGNGNGIDSISGNGFNEISGNDNGVIGGKGNASTPIINANQLLAKSGPKNSVTSSEQYQAPLSDNLQKYISNKKQNKMTDFSNDYTLLVSKTDDVNINDLFSTAKPLLASGTTTPISASNNILYEIERSQSRNTNQPTTINLDLSYNNNTTNELQQQQQLQKPIAVLASTKTTTTATASVYCGNGNINGKNNDINNKNNAARLTFLQKLRKAASQTPTAPAAATTNKQISTPLRVRKDLMSDVTDKLLHHSHSTRVSLSSPKSTNLIFSARCNPCNKLFETLAALEVHNAKNHNTIMVQQQQQQPIIKTDQRRIDEKEEERKRIIALFEDDSFDDV